MPPQLKQTLISTSVVGAILGSFPAAALIVFSLLDAGDDDYGPAFVLRFDPLFLGYALAVFFGAIAISTLLFGLTPWLIHQAVSRLMARRARA